jgi:uncharacterized protein (TIGR02246 family)
MADTELNDFGSRYAEAWSGQNPAKVASFFAQNGSLQINDGQPAIGRDAISSVAQSFMTALPDMVVKMDSLTVRGENVLFHWTLIATNSGQDGNGNSINVSGYEEWSLDSEGSISQSFGHMDTAEYERQLEYGANE